MVCAMGSLKMYDCIQRVRQTSENCSMAGKSHRSIQVHILCPRISRASSAAAMPEFGGEAVRGLELSCIIFPGLMCPPSAGVDHAGEGLWSVLGAAAQAALI